MIHWLFSSLLATSVLLAVVLLLRGPALGTFGPKVAYALWALPAIRLVLPPLPTPFALLPDLFAPPPPVDASAFSSFAAPPPPVFAGMTLLILLWAAGAIVWFCWQMLRYRTFLARALDGAEPLGSSCGVEVLVSSAVTGPMATGVFRKRILLPADFTTRYTSAERRLALLHEGAHHDRRDILANLVALGFVAAHWWNPLAHLAYRCFRADQELACDATVLNDGSDGEDRQTYGSALLKSASARTTTVACALSHKDEVRRRIMTMLRPGFGIGRRITGAGGALTLVLAGAVLSATAQAAPPDSMRDLSAWFAPTVRDFDQVQRDMAVEAADMARFAAESRRDAAQMARDSRNTRRTLSQSGGSPARR